MVHFQVPTRRALGSQEVSPRKAHPCTALLQAWERRLGLPIPSTQVYHLSPSQIPQSFLNSN